MGKQCKQWQTLFSWAPKSLRMVTAAMKLRHLLLGRHFQALAPWKKSYDQPRQHTKKQRHYFANKGPSGLSYFSNSPICMWKLDHKGGWALKNSAFELWCWRRLLRVSWPARGSNLSILKDINPIYSLEGLMLKLKLHCFGHLMWRPTHEIRPWCWERLRAGEEGSAKG